MMILLGFMIVILVIIVAVLISRICKTKNELKAAVDIVEDIAGGNMDRRLIIDEKSPAAELCYKINEVIIHAKAELVSHQQSEKAYRQLITSLSHDIRTPLASLTGHLEAIQLGIAEDDEKDEYLDISLHKALDLKYYIDTLFEWLKLESGERIYHFEHINICEYVREVAAEWVPQFEKNNMNYEIMIPEAELLVLTDHSAFRRVIDNLMQNILIHSKASMIKIEVQADEKTVRLSITDDGIGISEEHLPHIFERLFKCNTARGVTGNGLGLAIVRELVKGLKGEITVQSKVDYGTCFCVSLPIKNS